MMKNFVKLLIGFLFLSLKNVSLWGLGESMSISGSPSTFVINTAVAGSQPDFATDVTTTYNASILLGAARITGAVNIAFPPGISLLISMAAPSGATSQGAVNITTTAKNLVIGISTLTVGNNLAIAYALSATVNASTVTNGTRTITYTIGP